MQNKELVSATENLYREYKDHVFNYIYRLSSNYDQSLDVTQQTFLKILSDKNILSLKSPKAYLFTVARNTLYNEWKKKKEYRLSDEGQDQAKQIPDEQTAIPELDAEQDDLKIKIEATLKSLPEKNRELMLLHYSEGLWTGPNNDNDRLVLFDTNNPPKQLSYFQVQSGYMKYLIAPKTTGDYEIVYKTKGGKILARSNLKVIAN